MNTVYWAIFKVLNFRDSCACRENWFCESVATPLYVSTWVIRVNYFPRKFNFGKMRKFSTSKITRYMVDDKWGNLLYDVEPGISFVQVWTTKIVATTLLVDICLKFIFLIVIAET